MPDAPTDSRRTTWPAAAPLQEAADILRETPFYTRRLGKLTDPIADLLEECANQLAWLAPYHDHEGGHGMWEAASRVAAVVNGTEPPSADAERRLRNCYTDETARRSLTQSPDRPCGRTQDHPPHKHVNGRASWQCPGVDAAAPDAAR